MVRIAIIYLVVNHICDAQSYRILYPDESDPNVPFCWELDKEESMIYAVTHQGRLCDPLPLRSQPRCLLDEHQNSSRLDENNKAIAEDKVAIVDSLNSLSLSDSEELDNQQTRLDNI